MLAIEEPIDEVYFNWLIELSGIHDKGDSKYFELCRELYLYPFSWINDHDDNRAADGIELRLTFVRKTNADREEYWLDLDCSMLEFLIALAQRASFETAISHTIWFRTLLANLGFIHYTDYYWNPSTSAFVIDAVETFLSREYGYDGGGGLFPLKHPRSDQTKVEIWYQMHSYIQENNLWG